MTSGTDSEPGLVARSAAKVSSSLWTLAGLLAASELVYIVLTRFHAISTAESVIWFLALMGVLFVFYGAAYLVLRNVGPSRTALALVIAGAILFRITLLFAGVSHHTDVVAAIRADVRGEAVTYESFLLFDNDIWRYLWDGHVDAQGISPYRFEPRSPELNSLADSAAGRTFWGDIRANVNHPDIPTIYPPLAQMAFRMAHTLAPGSVFVMKLLLVIFDLSTILLVALTLRALHRPVLEIVLFAWNPLIIKAVAGSGHVDAVLAMTLASTAYFVVKGRHTQAAVAWGLSVLVKISPIVLLPFLIQRLGWRRTALGAAVVLIGYMPYLDSRGSAFRGLWIFANEWQFNSGTFALLEWLARSLSPEPILIAKFASASMFLAVIGYTFYKDDGDVSTFASCSVIALGGLLLLSPTVMPWYLVWIIPLAVIARSFAWIQFSALVCVAFLVMIDGRERAWILCGEYAVFAVLLWHEYSNSRRGSDTLLLAQGSTLRQVSGK